MPQSSFSSPVERMRGKQCCFIRLDTFERSVIMLLCASVMSNKTHNILKHLWCFHVFYKNKPEIEGV